MLKYQKDTSWSLTYLLVSASTEVQVKLLAAGDSFTMAVTEVAGVGNSHGKTPATYLVKICFVCLEPGWKPKLRKMWTRVQTDTDPHVWYDWMSRGRWLGQAWKSNRPWRPQNSNKALLKQSRLHSSKPLKKKSTCNPRMVEHFGEFLGS